MLSYLSCLFAGLFVCLFVCLFVGLFVCLFLSFFLANVTVVVASLNGTISMICVNLFCVLPDAVAALE